jgi:hypothetical protein
MNAPIHLASSAALTFLARASGGALVPLVAERGAAAQHAISTICMRTVRPRRALLVSEKARAFFGKNPGWCTLFSESPGPRGCLDFKALLFCSEELVN